MFVSGMKIERCICHVVASKFTVVTSICLVLLLFLSVFGSSSVHCHDVYMHVQFFHLFFFSAEQ